MQGKPVNEIRDRNGNITAATTTAQQTTYIPPIVESDVPLSQNSGDNLIDKVSDNLGNSSSLVEATGMILENTTVTKTGATAGAVVAIVKTSADAATTDFSNSEETADFVENTTQTAVETAAGPLGAAVDVILENGKDKNGLTNLNNNRMHDAYSTNKDRLDAYSIIMQYNSSGGSDKDKDKEK